MAVSGELSYKNCAMDLLPTSEQVQIVDSVRGFLRDKLPVARLHGRSGVPAQIPEGVWREALDLGLLSFGLPEQSGGSGYALIEEVLVARELGRVVGPARFLFGVLAAKVAASAGEASLTARILSGATRVAYALREDYSGAAHALNPRRVFDSDGSTIAMVDDGNRFRLLDISKLALSPAPCLDQSISMSLADLSGVPVLVDFESAELRRAASLLTAAMQLGIAEATRDMIVEYAKIRSTFGRPIGAYQAVRHPCAEMEARCQSAQAQLYFAALSEMEGRADAELQSGSARLLCQTAALRNADDNIQLHGGIGVTDEFDAHFFLKRAHVLCCWFGDRSVHLAHVLDAPLAA